MRWFIRELPGILLVLAYLLLLPPLLAKTVMRTFFIKMGFVRFFLLVTLIQFMAALPIKMVLRWTHQPEVHRLHPGVLLQHLMKHTNPKRKRGCGWFL